MRIIQVNKFYYPKDGVSNYVLGLEAELKKLGHEVAVFSMDNPKNIPSPYQKYFVSYISFDSGGIKNAWRAAFRIFYSREAEKKFTRLIKDFRPDIIHIHNIYHQISPSIIAAAKKHKIPVVMHLHDYKLICPNYSLFTRGKICEKCRGGKYYNCFLNNCLKNSRIKSLGGSLEMYFHHRLWPIYRTGVDLFIAPSKFMKETCVKFGWPEDKIKLVYNFYNRQSDDSLKNSLASDDSGNGSKEREKSPDKNYLLYFGRLAPEKGVDLILKALKNNQEKLKIAGEGSETERLKSLAEESGLADRVEFLGFESGKELEELISGAKAIIIPSVWLENMPLVLLESLALKKIVIAARIGGLPEIIRDGENGLLFNPGDYNDLSRKIKQLALINKEEIAAAAYETSKELNPGDHARKIAAIYQALANKPG